MKLKTQAHYLIFIGSYLCLHFVSRILFTDALELDEAEQAYLSQYFAFGYNQQPPLYTWVTQIITLVFGYSVASMIVFRFVILFFIYYFYYQIAFSLYKHTSWAIAASLSTILCLQFSIEGLRQTHTMLLTLVVIWMLWVFIKLLKNPKWSYFIILGILLGVGVLSKYNFIIVALAGIFSYLQFVTYPLKQIIPKLVVSILIGFIIALPHLYWVTQHLDHQVATTLQELKDEEYNFLIHILVSVWSLIKGSFSFSGVLIITMFFLLWKKWKTFTIYFINQTHFVFYFFIHALILLCLILIVTQATNTHERWVQPILIVLPLLIFYAMQRIDLTAHTYTIQKSLLIVYALAIVYKSLAFVFAPQLGFKERINRPYAEFATFLKDNVLEEENAHFICGEQDLAGNLKIFFPEKKIKVLNNCDHLTLNQEHYTTHFITISTTRRLDKKIRSCLSTAHHYTEKKTLFFDYSTMPYTFYLTKSEQ